MTDQKKAIPAFVHCYPNLASTTLGAQVKAASDDFFGAKERLIQDQEPIFVPDKYDDHGKWMDGWESRRRRGEGHDWCLIELGTDGILYGADIDTSHFTGNFPPAASLEACSPNSDPDNPDAWVPILMQSKLGSSAHHYFDIKHHGPWRWIRLNIFPDGGVARLRLYGKTADQPIDESSTEEKLEVSALHHGGRILTYNDAHYGEVWSLLREGRGQSMGDGWETRRRREPGNDWIIIALGMRSTIDEIEIDTAYFKGNYPDSASVQAADLSGMTEDSIEAQAMFWQEIMSPQKLKADNIHRFHDTHLLASGPFTHVKLNIYPDGGISRFRVFGKRRP